MEITGFWIFNFLACSGMILNKIGISTLLSYRGSQIFEILGLNKKFVNKYFCNTPTRIEGIGLYEIEKEIQKRYQHAFFPPETETDLDLEMGGDYRWRRNGERHMFNPASIAKLQQAVKQNSYETYSEYSKIINEQTKRHRTGLKSLHDFSPWLYFFNRNRIKILEFEHSSNGH